MLDVVESESRRLYPVCETVLRQMQDATEHLISVVGNAQSSWTYEIRAISEDAIASFSIGFCRTTPITTIMPNHLKFQSLLSEWHKERGATSSITSMAMCPSYQKIVGMGPDVVPLILGQMENEGDDPDHWFWALQTITCTNPVTEDARGDMREMARTWLDWAYMAGYDW